MYIWLPSVQILHLSMPSMYHGVRHVLSCWVNFFIIANVHGSWTMFQEGEKRIGCLGGGLYRMLTRKEAGLDPGALVLLTTCDI